MTGAETPDPDGLQDGGCPADDERREDRPGQIDLALGGRPDHNRRGQHDPAYYEHGRLKADTEGEQGRGVFVGLVANSVFAERRICFHTYTISLV